MRRAERRPSRSSTTATPPTRVRGWRRSAPRRARHWSLSSTWAGRGRTSACLPSQRPAPGRDTGWRRLRIRSARTRRRCRAPEVGDRRADGHRRRRLEPRPRRASRRARRGRRSPRRRHDDGRNRRRRAARQRRGRRRGPRVSGDLRGGPPAPRRGLAGGDGSRGLLDRITVWAADEFVRPGALRRSNSGAFTLPALPGSGLAIDWHAVARHATRSSRYPESV